MKKTTVISLSIDTVDLVIIDRMINDLRSEYPEVKLSRTKVFTECAKLVLSNKKLLDITLFDEKGTWKEVKRDKVKADKQPKEVEHDERQQVKYSSLLIQNDNSQSQQTKSPAKTVFDEFDSVLWDEKDILLGVINGYCRTNNTRMEEGKELQSLHECIRYMVINKKFQRYSVLNFINRETVMDQYPSLRNLLDGTYTEPEPLLDELFTILDQTL